ncbi:MAG: ABC transporter permease [Candidatus Bipolaricaulota bacterium]|nr:ABC transporter permease [Candidatus Bipolaricaulota bacterium]
MIWDHLLWSVHNLRTRPARAGLTVLGVVVGVAAVVALVSIGQGLQRSVHEEFRAIGYNTVVVTPGLASGDAGSDALALEALVGRFIQAQPEATGGRAAPFREAVRRPVSSALDEVRALPEVARAGVIRTEIAFVTSAGMAGLGVLHVTGVSSGIFEDFPGYFPGFAVAEGRCFRSPDELSLVLGADVARDLGASVGSVVRVEDQEFTVVGILARTTTGGVGVTFGNLNLALFAPIETVALLYGNPDRISLGLVEARPGEDVNGVAAAVRTVFARSGIPVTAVSTKELSARITAVLGDLQTTLAAIAAVALLAGGIGVMNTMYTSVLERTRHIGIMKAVGAKDRHVLGLFLVESGLLGLLGGAIGTLAGAVMSGVAAAGVGRTLQGASELTSLAGGILPRFEPWLILAALGGSALLGAVAGALPALRAARLRPVEALRHA